MTYSDEQIYDAIRKADAAGDGDSVRRLSEHLQGSKSAAPAAAPADDKFGFVKGLGQQVMNAGAGAVRGAGSIGATILAPYDMARDAMDGKGLSLESNRKRRSDMDAALGSLGADPESLLYGVGKLGGEIAGTAGMGGVLARGASAIPLLSARAAPLIDAVGSAGLRAGGATGLAGAGARAAGGAITGGLSAGLVSPEDAALGAGVGAVMPGALQLAGKAGDAAGRLMRGPEQGPDIAAAIKAARDAGYVIPPTQARPSFGNRVIEGFSGKLTTAQNASARNQGITNRLASESLGLAGDTKLTPDLLADIRKTAGAAYEAIASSGVSPKQLAAKGATQDVKEGFVRLYRADSPSVKFDDVFEKDGLAEFASKLPGMRYTDDLKYADYFRKTYGNDATISYVDVPKALAEAGRINGFEYKIPDLAKVVPGKEYGNALDKIAAPFIKSAEAFPNAKPSPVLDLVESLKSPSFDASAAVAKIKELRTAADDAFRTGNTDIARASKGAAKALEDALEDHLTKSGAPDLLKGFRDARQLIAKTYSVEKAMNPTSGSVDARKLAAQLNKGKPLSAELKTAAGFANQFPKASQAIEGMGSLPQTSPLDWAYGMSLAAGTGSPMGMLGLLARPAARGAALSPMVQNRLIQGNPSALNGLLHSDSFNRAGLLSAPIWASDQ